jgi:hypothetical protein
MKTVCIYKVVTTELGGEKLEPPEVYFSLYSSCEGIDPSECQEVSADDGGQEYVLPEGIFVAESDILEDGVGRDFFYLQKSDSEKSDSGFDTLILMRLGRLTESPTPVLIDLSGKVSPMVLERRG